ncbi:MAG: hypothetical protein R8K21_01320 [Mariprofundales bacterium]
MASTQNQQAKHFWSEHLEQWHSSGLSQAAYCRKYDLCQQLLAIENDRLIFFVRVKQRDQQALHVLK